MGHRWCAHFWIVLWNFVHSPLGQEEFDRLRSLSYAETHVIMICFSVSRPFTTPNHCKR